MLHGFSSFLQNSFLFFSSRRRHTRCYRDWSSRVLFRTPPHFGHLATKVFMIKVSPHPWHLASKPPSGIGAFFIAPPCALYTNSTSSAPSEKGPAPVEQLPHSPIINLLNI